LGKSIRGSQNFPGTGKLTGAFRDFGEKPASYAQIPQFCFQEQGLTGNFQFSSQVIQNQSDTRTQTIWPTLTGNLSGIFPVVGGTLNWRAALPLELASPDHAITKSPDFVLAKTRLSKSTQGRIF
jgi:hypothetical protein